MIEVTAGGAVMVAFSLGKPEAWDAITKARNTPPWKMLLIPDEVRMVVMDAKAVRHAGKK